MKIRIKFNLMLSFLLTLAGFTFSQTHNSYELILEINKELPKYLFKFNCQKVDSIFYKYKIEIYQEKSLLLLQVIDLYEDYYVPYTKHEFPNFRSLEDINFDGYGDMVIECGRARMGKNICNMSFLFNEKDMKFYYDQDFSLYNMEVDDSLKQLFEAYWYGGCIDCIEFKTFQVIDRRLYLIKTEKQYSDEEEKLFISVEYYDTTGNVIKRVVTEIE